MFLQHWESIEAYVSELEAFLEEYGWLSELCIVDFFTHNVWDRLPREWHPICDADMDVLWTQLLALASHGTVQVSLSVHCDQGRSSGQRRSRRLSVEHDD
jgi:hypothetical protein